MIDDNPTAVEFARSALRRGSHRVEHLDTFVNLPNLLQERPPELIILDLDMPMMAGRVVGRLIRRYHGRAIPIVIFSAGEPETLDAAAIEVDADLVLRKGIAAEDFFRSIENVLQSRSASTAG